MTPQPLPEASLPWHEVWITAVTKPSTSTFERLVQDPQASANRAYPWIFVSATIAFALSWLLQAAQGMVPGLLVFCAPVVGGAAILGTIFGTAIIQWLARSMGGLGTYDKTLYCFAAYGAPLGLLSSVLAPIPAVGAWLNLALNLYSLVLSVIALKAVHQFTWGKAVTALAIPGLIAALPICMLALMGPAIDRVYTNILLTASAAP
jgi:hypothetical protein